ncbi:MAG: tetratricopeptide repeat protein [Verrucomicrobia bacterium]|nr:tetratricopeptide repeat protein [Verrucomicrobiota bacterium]
MSSPSRERKTHIRLITLLFLSTLLTTSIQANPANFIAANDLYEQQNFSEAASAYKSLVESGTVTPNIFFNLGNAHFKSGEFGKAIAAYRAAQNLTPRDPDIRANLRFARDKAQNAGASAAQESWLNRLTANEWILLASVPFWLCFILLAFAQIRRDWQKIVRSYATILGGLALVFGICAAVAAQHDAHQAAVVTSVEAVVRHGPFAESQTAFTLRDGAELTVLDQRENWIQVSAGPNRIGWVRAAQVTVIN